MSPRQSEFPNISGKTGGLDGSLSLGAAVAEGAFYNASGKNTYILGTGDATKNQEFNVSFSAQKSSSFYGKTNTVQPASVQTFMIIKV